MCNYNGVRVSRTELIRLKEAEIDTKNYDLFRPVQNGFDYLDWPVIRASKDCRYELVMMEWGFIPFNVKNREAVKKFRSGYKNEATGKWIPGFTTLNAVGEELLVEGKMYREAALRRRCLLISSGFVEWQHFREVGKSGKILKTPGKYPYKISVKDTFRCYAVPDHNQNVEYQIMARFDTVEDAKDVASNIWNMYGDTVFLRKEPELVNTRQLELVAKRPFLKKKLTS